MKQARQLILTTFIAATAVGQNLPSVKEFADRARAEIAAGEFRKAIDTTDECLAKIPSGPWECHHLRGQTLLRFPHSGIAAMLSLEKAAEKMPVNKEVQYDLGRAFRSNFMATEAIGAFTAAIKIDPRYKNAYIGRAQAYYDLISSVGDKNLDKAILDVNKVIELDPKDAKAYQMRGTFYASRLDWSNAVSDHTKAIKLDPSFAEPLVSRATIYGLQGKYDLAITDINKAISLDPKSDIAFKARAAFLCNTGKKDLANADEKTVIELGGKVEQPCKY